MLQAIEAAQCNPLDTACEKQTSFAMLQNRVARPVGGLLFKVEAWAGGLVSSAGKLVDGRFK